MNAIVTIENHTTASAPRPHIVYDVKVTVNGKEYTTHKRYSDFVALHDLLKDPFELPPKRLLVTTFVPSAWADDALVAERKKGLAEWLKNLLGTVLFSDSKSLFDFFASDTAQDEEQPDINLEDALPSTLTRAAAVKLIEHLEPLSAAPCSAAETLTTPDAASAAAAITSPIAGSYYPFWAAGRVPPEGLDYSRWDILWFAFVTPSSSNTITWSGGSQAILKRLVTSAKDSGHGTKICLAVGGWGGCQYFSQACSNAANRTKFANALVNAVNTYNLDGIDLDWEYPNSPGAGQPYNAKDADNLFALIQLLRTALGPCRIISAAVPHAPWLGSDGKPLKDVSRFAALMDYINIMNYDVWGASSSPGPNAPIGNLCGTSRQPDASAQGALDLWTAAKFPKEKLVLGCATYGYVSKSSKTVLTGSSVPSDGMLVLDTEGEADAAEPMAFLNAAHPNETLPEGTVAAAAPSATATANLQAYWGKQLAFYEIVKAGALKKRSDGNYGQNGGYTMGWDNCSNTPYLFNTAQQVVVSYDDTWSLTDKAKFARQKGMAGCFTWSLDQDDGVTLQNAIRKGLGKPN